MKHIINISWILTLCVVFVACSSNEDFVKTEEPVEILPEGALMEQADFEDGDGVSRSTLIFDNDLLRFGWKADDPVGIFATAGESETTPADKTEQDLFVAATDADNVVHLDYPDSETKDYDWKDGHKRTAYYKYNSSFSPNNKSHPYTYKELPFSFENQTQKGFVDMTAFYYGTSDEAAGNSNSVYRKSEEEACAHLGDADVLISPEVTFSDHRIRFPMRHIGAVARFFLLAPEEKMQMVSLRLVATKPIFYTKGFFDLTSTEYKPDATDKGLHLISDYEPDKPRQVKPDGDPVSTLKLDFDGVKTCYDAQNPCGNYLVAYMMMYPVNTAGCELYVYLEAKSLDADGNPTGKIKTYRTDNINKTPKNMFSGNYYQWLDVTLDDEHPIELTATEIPWQDVVGGSINLGEEE